MNAGMGRAAVTTGPTGPMELRQYPLHDPRPGEILVRVSLAMICGSDLHVRHHCDEMADLVAEVGYPHIFRSTDPVVLAEDTKVFGVTPRVLGFELHARRSEPVPSGDRSMPSIRPA